MAAIFHNELVRARELVLDGADLNAKDDQGCDALDYLSRVQSPFTKDKIKLCALLLLNKGMKMRVDHYLRESLLPGNRNTYDQILEKRRTIKERNQILNEKLSHIVADAVKTLTPLTAAEQQDFSIANRTIFESLSKIPELTPLLKITAYATNKYFSKNRRELSLITDPKNFGFKTKMETGGGFFSPSDNVIQVAGRQGLPSQPVACTWIHEITHYVARDVFDNNSKPYRFDSREMAKFSSILTELKRMQKESLLPPKFSDIFDCYEVSKQASEIIARISEIVFYPFLSIQFSDDIPSDDEVKKGTTLFLYKENGSLNNAFLTTGSSPRVVKQFCFANPPDELFQQLEGNRPLTQQEREFFIPTLQGFGYNVARDEFIDMQKRLIEFYKDDFLPECEKYIKAFRLKKCLFT